MAAERMVRGLAHRLPDPQRSAGVQASTASAPAALRAAVERLPTYPLAVVSDAAVTKGIKRSIDSKTDIVLGRSNRESALTEGIDIWAIERLAGRLEDWFDARDR
jgi:hypothetical protein